MEPTLSQSSKQAGGDLVIGLCGFVTSVATGAVLWAIEQVTGFAFYTWMFWFVIPAGALLSGFAGASGYWAGAHLFGRRPTKILLVNVVAASVATFLTIHYLGYLTLRVEGKAVSHYISFWRYLDIVTESASMQFRLQMVPLGSTGKMGLWGYIPAVLQVIGFAIGGVAVFGYLNDQPYCDSCSRYLSRKGKQQRHTADPDALQATATTINQQLAAGDVTAAMASHAAFGQESEGRDQYLRSNLDLRVCNGCNRHWLKFSVEKQSGKNWKEIRELTVSNFVEGVVSR